MMITKIPTREIWKRIPGIIDLVPVDSVIKEIEEQTSWSVDSIREKLFVHKTLICVPGARYHIYRECLG